MKPVLIRTLIRLALALPAVLAAQSPSGTESPKQLEPFEVTGSRVKRLDYELPSPVVTYTAEEIAATGAVTIGDFIQTLSFNSGDYNSELIPTGGWVPGAATANPRGLGSNRLLTLISGRRTAPFSMTNSLTGSPQSVFNFNSIPFDAVERVEYLKDGASALYGSDAITGVMNIILKKNYSGASLDLSYSNSLAAHDAQTRRATLFAGGAKGGWDGMIGLSHQERHSSFLSDYGVRTTDYRYLGIKGADWRSTQMSPAYLNLTAALARDAGLGTAGGYYVISGGAPTSTPTKSSFAYAGPNTASIPDANRYDLVNKVQLVPASDTTSLFGTVGRRLGGETSAYAQFTLNRNRLYVVDQPIYGVLSDTFTVPATNPYNPFGIALPGSRVPFSTGEFQPRDQSTSEAVTGIAGLRGRIGANWEWESAVSYGVNHTFYEQDGAQLTEVLAAINSTTRATAYNPFGPSDNPNLFRELFRHRFTINNNLAEALSTTLTVSGKPWKLPLRGAGELGMAAGYEFRRESLASRPNQTPYFAYIGGTAAPWSGHRQVHAVSAELTLPLQKWVEVQLAGRHEHYSDFGSATNPKVGVSLRLPETRFIHVMLRASRSGSFKSPDFGQLYQPRIPSTAGSYLDPLRPQDGSRVLIQQVAGSPGLEPEKGTVQYAGAIFDVKAVRGLSFTTDFLDIQVRGVISKLDAPYLLSEEGRRLYPDAIVRDNRTENPGPISYLLALYTNRGLQLYRGWDFGARYFAPPTRWGRFSFNASATQVMKRGSDAGTGAGFTDRTGDAYTPEWRYNYSAGWSRERLSANVSAAVLGKLYNRRSSTVAWGENPFTVITPSFTYRGFARTTLTLSCSNVLDNRPPPNGRTNIRGFDIYMYGMGAAGRTLSLRARRDF